MSSLKRWWGLLAGMVAAVFASLLVPAAAWAASNETALEVARRRPRMGSGSIFAGLCCLVVVVIVVVLLLLLMRGGRRRR